MAAKSSQSLRAENERLCSDNEELRLRLDEANQALEAIRTGQAESLVVDGPDGIRIFSLESADHSYRVLVETMNEGAATLAEDGTILYCNSRFAQMVGGPLERVMGSSIFQFLPERSRPGFEALLNDGAEADESRGELDLVAQAGQVVPAHLSVSVIHEGGRQRLCLIATDLRAQKRNEEIVADERLARSVLEQAADAIVVCDSNGRIIRANGPAAELSGSNPLFSSFDSAFSLVFATSDDGGRPAQSALVQAMRGVVLRAVPASLVRRDGSRKELLVSAKALDISGKRAIGCVVTLVDVTEHRRAGEALRVSVTDRKQRDRLSVALDTINQAIHSTRQLDELTGSAIRLAAPALGADAAVVSLRTNEHWPIRYVHGVTRETVGSRLDDEQQKYAMMALGERHPIVIGDASDEKHGIRAALVVPLVSRGEPTGVVFFKYDRAVELDRAQLDFAEKLAWALSLAIEDARLIAGLAESERSLREAVVRRNEFLAVLSHELRNPLAPIKNSLFIMDRAVPGSDQARRAREVISRQVGQLGRLVDDLLDVTRITRNKIRLQRQRLELNELVKTALDDYCSVFEGAGVSLELTPAAEPVYVNGDRDRLAQILGHLLQNAAKFTEPGGVTRISVKRDAVDERAVIRIADTGLGMSAQMVSRLFEPFSQADQTLDRSKGGLGLGLCLVKGLVELHGGGISARSDGLGQGTELAVSLPLDLGATAESPRVRAAECGRRRILIIEDNLDVAESLREALLLGDHEVEVAHDGPHGIAKARDFRPEIVLCDIGLPGMDGYEVARTFRSDDTLDEIHLVALSGYALPEDVARAHDAGFQSHLAKPPSLEKLERVLAAVSARPAF